jgi:hypothetical protein
MSNILQIVPCASNTYAVYESDGKKRHHHVHAWGLNGDGEVIGLVQQDGFGFTILLPADDEAVAEGKFLEYVTNPNPVRVYGTFNDDRVGITSVGD